MSGLVALFMLSVFANNVILSQFLGLCPFLGVSRKISTAAGMGAAVLFVITAAAVITYPLERLLLYLNIGFLRTMVFILVIAGLVQIIELFLKKKAEGLYRALGVYLPLITTNCAVLGTAIRSAEAGYSFIKSVVYAAGVSCGFIIAIVIMAGLREKIENNNDIPKAFAGMPITLITAGLMAIAFFGFSQMGG